MMPIIKFLRYFLVILLLVITLVPSLSFAQTTSDIGFISSNIWYSKDKLEEGDMVKVYTSVWNGSKSQFEGNVIFYDKTVVLGNKKILVGPENVGVTSIDWKVTAGDHAISAKISNTIIIKDNQKEDILIKNNETPVINESISKKIGGTIGINNLAIPDSVLPFSLSEIIDYIKGKVPESVTETVTLSAGKVDSWRELKLSGIDKKLNSITEDQKVKRSIYNVLLYIFNHKYLFYGLVIAVILVVIGFIRRRIF
jgi:hypothetical protein